MVIDDMPLFDDLFDIMLWVNRPYIDRDNDGIWYPDDYVRINDLDYSWLKINGNCNQKYWDTIDGINVSKYGKSSSAALLSFFKGPTFSECGKVLQAAMYLMILQKYGPIEFDRMYPVITLSGDMDNPPEELNFLIKRMDDIENLENGDIVYMRGVVEHDMKHLSGFVGGWYLIYMNGQFIGFGPETFKDGPKTYDEMRQVFIKYYNDEQTVETKIISIGLDDNDPQNRFRKWYNRILEHHKVSDDVEIIGIMRRMVYKLS